MSDGKPNGNWFKDTGLPTLQGVAVGGAILWGGITFLSDLRAVASDVAEVKLDVQQTNNRVEKLYELFVYPAAGARSQ